MLLLLARGAPNRQIAKELVIAPKTVANHVEHILTRLTLRRRAEIATWVAQRKPHEVPSAEP